jgi:hypothetical protein
MHREPAEMTPANSPFPCALSESTNQYLGDLYIAASTGQKPLFDAVALV